MQRLKKISYRWYLGAVLSFLFIWHFIIPIAYSKTQINVSSSLMTVSTASVISIPWQSDFTAIGIVKASQSINVSSETAGIIETLNFDSGQVVQAGTLLATLHADQYVAAINKVKSTLALDSKQYQRKKELLLKHYISEADIDTAAAQVSLDSAALQEATAELNQHRIVAPFTGRVGIREVDIGKYIQAGESIVNLESLSPAYIDFKIPEKWAHQVEVGTKVTLTSDALANRILTATITATDLRIDPSSHSITIRCVSSNNDQALLSGMSVTVHIPQNTQLTLTIPEAALSYDPNGTLVFVVDKNQRVHSRYIQCGERDGEKVVVTRGLQAGDSIVIAGQQKLQEGMQVHINNQLMSEKI